MQARDIMTRTVVTVPPDLPVISLANLLVERRISGAPVLEHDRVVGMVTEGDLCRRAELGTERRHGRWAELFTSNAKLADEFVHAHGRTVREIMSKTPICVRTDTPIAEIAELFETRGVKRVPVLDADGKLAGLVSRANLVQAIAARHTVPQNRGADRADADVGLRDAVMRAFAQHRWGLHSDSNVIVTDGRVHLWGLVGSEAEQTALRIAAESVPGVKRVEDHTTVADSLSEIGPWSEANYPAFVAPTSTFPLA
jgi:CBS domain-containing protein